MCFQNWCIIDNLQNKLKYTKFVLFKCFMKREEDEYFNTSTFTGVFLAHLSQASLFMMDMNVMVILVFKSFHWKIGLIWIYLGFSQIHPWLKADIHPH